MFFKFGLASGTYFKSQKKKKQIAIIAKDTRLSGYTLEPALVSGLASAGMNIYTLGPLPTNGLLAPRNMIAAEQNQDMILSQEQMFLAQFLPAAGLTQLPVGQPPLESKKGKK